ncbi:hypothetical protein NDN08_007798 [Rhodosorus marinus]|uniref:Uncharacterized protein n=1 Tax=Rhodosorus marinus TaxID=101924 RepID=A0AAV8V3Y5_9RHOD|nr:hypothetical protein NDN08_007798 [Rhodosorus marinus]
MGKFALGFLAGAGVWNGEDERVCVCRNRSRRVSWEIQPRYARVVCIRALNDDLGFTDVETKEYTGPPQKELYEGPESVVGLAIAGVAVLVDVLKSVVTVFTGPPSSSAKLSQRIRMLEREADRLKSDKLNLEENLLAYREIEAEKELLQSKALEMEMKVSESDLRSSEVRTKAEISEMKMVELEAALKMADLTKANVEEQAIRLRSDVDSRDKIIKSLSEEKGRLSEQIRALNKQIKTSEERKQVYKDQYASSDVEMKALQARTMELESKLVSLEQENSALREEQKVLTGLQARIRDLEGTLSGMKTTLETKEEHIAALSDEKEAVLDQLNSGRVEYATLQGRCTGMQEETDSKNAEIANLKGKLAEQIAGLSELREKEAEKQQLAKLLREQEQAKVTLQEQLARQAKAEAEARATLQDQLSRKIKQVEDSKVLVEQQLRNQLKEMEQGRKIAMGQLPELEKMLAQKASRIRDLEGLQRQSEGSLAEARAMGMAWENYNAELEAKYNELEERYQKLEEVDALLKQQETETAKARDEVKTAKEKSQKLEEELIELRTLKETAVQELDEVNGSTTKELEELQAMLQSVEEERARDLELLKSEKEMLVEDNQTKVDSILKLVMQKEVELSQKEKMVTALERQLSDALEANDRALDRANAETSHLEDALMAAEEELSQVGVDLQRSATATEQALARRELAEEKVRSLQRESLVEYQRELVPWLLETVRNVQAGGLLPDLDHDEPEAVLYFKRIALAKLTEAPIEQNVAPAVAGDGDEVKKQLLKLYGFLSDISQDMVDNGLTATAEMSQDVLQQVKESVDIDSLYGSRTTGGARSESTVSTNQIMAGLSAAEGSGPVGIGESEKGGKRKATRKRSPPRSKASAESSTGLPEIGSEEFTELLNLNGFTVDETEWLKEGTIEGEEEEVLVDMLMQKQIEKIDPVFDGSAVTGDGNGVVDEFAADGSVSNALSGESTEQKKKKKDSSAPAKKRRGRPRKKEG